MLPQSCHNAAPPSPHCSSPLQACTCLCFALVPFIHFEICRSGNWYRRNLPLSLLSLHSHLCSVLPPPRIPRQPPPLTRPKSIHSYLCQTKSKSFMPFLGRRQLFFSQFYWHAAISVSWSLSKWTPSQLPPPPIPLSPFPAGNVTHFIKLCNARIIAQIRTKRHNRCGAGVPREWKQKKKKQEKVPTGKLISLRKWLLLLFLPSAIQQSGNDENAERIFEIILQAKSKSITNCDSFEIN